MIFDSHLHGHLPIATNLLVDTQVVSLLVLGNLFLEGVDELAQSHIELLATLQNGIRWRNLPISLHFHFDFLFKRVRLLVASKSDPRVLQQLISQAISECVILIFDGHRSLESLPRIIFIGNSVFNQMSNHK